MGFEDRNQTEKQSAQMDTLTCC